MNETNLPDWERELLERASSMEAVEAILRHEGFHNRSALVAKNIVSALSGTSWAVERSILDRYAAAIANVAVYTSNQAAVSGDEVAALLRGEIPARLR